MVDDKHLATWREIVADCKRTWQRSINVGSDKRRQAILAIDEIVRGAPYPVERLVRCEICGHDQGIRRFPAVLTGIDVSMCHDCFVVWYDKGLTESEKIKALVQAQRAQRKARLARVDPIVKIRRTNCPKCRKSWNWEQGKEYRVIMNGKLRKYKPRGKRPRCLMCVKDKDVFERAKVDGISVADRQRVARGRIAFDAYDES